MFKDVGVIEKFMKVVVCEMRKGVKVIFFSVEGSYNVLKKYVVNLNERVQNGKLDFVIGRDEEIRRVLYILV